jgi:hypothetical protein
VKAAWRLPRQRSALAPRPANVLREGESAIVAASGFGSPTEPLGSPSIPSSRPRRPCSIGSDPISGLPEEITSDQIRPHIAARRKMQLAGCKMQKPTRLWARECGGPELYGKAISHQTNDNSITIGLVACSRDCGRTPGSAWSIFPDDRGAVVGLLFCCLHYFVSLSAVMLSRGSHALQQCYSL